MKKVLVIVYYWPPSGGAGVQRWLKFVKYLPDFGWLPTVITTRDGDYPAVDESLLQDVPSQVTIIRTKTPSFGIFFSRASGQKLPYGSLEAESEDSLLRKAAFWFRRNLIVPDARRIWNRYALQAAEREIRSNDYKIIITSGPPHSTHLVGLKLKKKFNLKWIADFRDPWTKIDYLEKIKRHHLIEFVDRKLESKVILRCDLILSINQKILDDWQVQEKGRVIPNGFDPADFVGIERVKTKHFEINYFGNITSERNPAAILQAANQLLAILPEIRINFWGNVTLEVQGELRALDTNNIVVFHDYIAHDIMLRKMVNSSVLLLLINNVPDNHGILTGKIFEYLGAQVPILALGPKDGEAAAILQEMNAGKIFEYTDETALRDFIREKYEFWKQGKQVKAKSEINKFNRRNQTEKLTLLLEDLSA